ncbi:MAG: hypothetical protein ROR55_06260 [Devosia sp.]
MNELIKATEETLSATTIAAKTNARRLIIILDRSNEFHALSSRFFDALYAIANVCPERQIAIIFMQNNRCLATAYATHPVVDKPLCAFHPYHHHLCQIMDGGEAQGVQWRALSLLDQEPDKALLCLNNKPRYHRLYCLKWLLDTLPVEEFLATFGGVWQGQLVQPHRTVALGSKPNQ